jgi:hypothetical protein
VVGLLVGFAGLGLGFNLGRQSTALPTEDATAAIPPPATAAPTPTEPVADLRPPSVSTRLRLAYEASAPSTWAICEVGSVVTCHMLAPNSDRESAGSHTTAFTSGDMAELPRPQVARGHLVLAARLGEGVVTGSLVTLNAGGGQAESQALRALDPDASGVDFFDLGNLGDGTYALLVNVVPQSEIGAASPSLDSYLAFFVAAG